MCLLIVASFTWISIRYTLTYRQQGTLRHAAPVRAVLPTTIAVRVPELVARSTNRIPGNQSRRIVTMKDDVQMKNGQSATDLYRCNETQFVVIVCSEESCGGWANRQRGIISTYILSVLMNRKFAILHEKPCDISKFLLPNEYDWRSCIGYIRKIKRTTANTPKIEGFLNRSINFEDYKKEHVIFIRTHHNWILQLADHPNALRMFPWIINKTIPEVSKYVLAKLFRTSDILENAIRNYTSMVSNRTQLICSHIRMGKNPTMPNDSDRKVPNVSVIFDWLKKYDNRTKYSLFIATDSEDIKNFARSKFTNILVTNLPIVHVDRVRNDQSEIACHGLFSALLEQNLLSRCDVLLLTRSNFGPMAAYMSKRSQQIYIHKWNRIFQVEFNNVPKLF